MPRITTRTSSRCQMSPGRVPGDGRRGRWPGRTPPPTGGSSRRGQDPSFEQQLLDEAQTEREADVEPYGVADDVGREAVTMVRIRSAFHPATMPHANASRHPIKLM